MMRRIMTTFCAGCILLSSRGISAADYTVTANVSTPVRTLSPNYHGVNYVAFWDNNRGSSGAREALRRAGVQIIRFPGGVPGNYYDWNASTTWTTTTTDSIFKFAQAVGARLMLQTNPTTNSVNDQNQPNDSSGAHVAEWVRYCLAKGYDVPLWEIGNEPEGEKPASWNLGDWDSTQLRGYLDAFNRQSSAMKATGANTTIMGPAAANVWYWWHQHELELFLKFCNAHADAVSLHWYGDDTLFSTGSGFAQGWYANWNYIHSVTQKPVYITEWNNHGDKGNFNTTAGNALVNADVIGVFARTGVAGHCWFGSLHGGSNGGYGAWGIFYGGGESKALDTPTPAYFILPLWTHMGNQVLGVACTADSAKVLSVFAHKKTNGSVQVMLINKAGQITADVKFQGFDPTGCPVSTYELRPANGQPEDINIAYNGINNPDPGKQDLPAPQQSTCAAATIALTLRAYSVTMIDIGPRPGTVARGARRVQPAQVCHWNARDNGIAFSVSPAGKGTLRIFDCTGILRAQFTAEDASSTHPVWHPGARGAYVARFDDGRTSRTEIIVVR